MTTTTATEATTTRRADCRYCTRYDRACGRIHTAANAGDWRRDRNGEPLPVSLRKAQHEPVRFDCAAEDVWYALEGRPLWWDEASYRRYQSDTGDEWWPVYRLNRGDGAPIQRGTAGYECNEAGEYVLAVSFDGDYVWQGPELPPSMIDVPF